jgi:hypothetical protein
MAQFETWFFIKDGILYKHYENDSYAAMRKGLEAVNTPLCTVEEARIKCPEILAKVENKDALCK